MRYLETRVLPPQGFSNLHPRVQTRVVETDNPAPGATPTDEDPRDWADAKEPE